MLRYTVIKRFPSWRPNQYFEIGDQVDVFQRSGDEYSVTTPLPVPATPEEIEAQKGAELNAAEVAEYLVINE